jgi:hypothetical protein
MPGNDARDPVDDWLERETQPLQPPAGTFEAISRRAHNRKMGKLFVVATSAAVVVGAALAVPSVLAPRTSPPLANGLSTGHTTAPTPSAGKSVPSVATNGATPNQTHLPGAASGSAAATGYPVGGQVPANFQPTSVTFIGQNAGWAIGQGGTPGKCANANASICTSVVLTQDGGRTWRGVTAPGTNYVSGIRFFNGQDGWAYGPQLWSTHDWGNTWQPVDTGGMVVTDLETEGGRAYAVWARCSMTPQTPSITFFGTQQCTGFGLETTPAGSDNWAPVTFNGTGGSSTTLTLNGTGPTVTTLPTIVLQGDAGWFVGPRGQVYVGSLTSSTWTLSSESPCATSTSPLVTRAMLDWSLAANDLIMACNGQQSTVIFSSGDGAVAWTKQVTAPGFGTATSLTASPSAPYILASNEGIEVLNASTGQWQQPVTLQGGFIYVGMTSDLQGVAVPANAGLHELYMTYDGGLTWTPSVP